LVIAVFDFLKYNAPNEKDSFELTFSDKEYIEKQKDYSTVKTKQNIFENYEYIKDILHTGINGDIVIRWFCINRKSESVKGFLVMADGLCNSASVNEYILSPLINTGIVFDDKVKNDIKYYVENIIAQGQTSYSNKIIDLAQSVNIGNVALFIDGCDEGVIIDVKFWEHRGVDTPLNESVVQGPHEAFNEMLRSNTALIRKTVNNPDLIMETFIFGKKGKIPASLAYIEGVINPGLLNEIKKRLENIDAEYILSVFDIEKKLEESAIMPFPQIISTERPDKASRALIEGRAVLILNGSSNVLILPSNITDIISSPEDSYLRLPYSVFIKCIRLIAIVLSLFTPALYLALTGFHRESILTDMLITLSEASRMVPFSPLTEVLIMEFSFELIKEAGVRIPGAIGSSLGIVGGLILGQAAVSAGLVSPIVIILVSVCGIASFAIPSYSLSFSFRLMRFVYIIAGGVFGITGIISVLMVHLATALGIKSFGVPLFVPFAPETKKYSFFKAVFKTHAEITKPEYLNTVKNEVNK